MAAKGSRIDFMFVAPPPPYPATGSAIAIYNFGNIEKNTRSTNLNSSK